MAAWDQSGSTALVTGASRGFGRAIARTWKPQLVSLLLVVAGALLGYYAASSDQVLAHALWPTADERQPGSTTEQLLAHLRRGREESGGYKFFFASFLFQHNLKVGILAMATGVLAAVPTVLQTPAPSSAGAGACDGCAAAPALPANRTVRTSSSARAIRRATGSIPSGSWWCRPGTPRAGCCP